jgi:predicted RND superfamily exporter protein
MKTDFYQRNASRILVAALIFAPLVVWGALRAYTRSDNSVDQWLPKNYETTDNYERFQRLFGSDEAILVSWVGCSLDDPRLEQLARHLEGDGDSTAGFPYVHLIERVTTGQREFRYLRTRPLSIQKKYALRRLQGTLIGPDQNTTCAIVTLASTNSEHRVEVVEAIRELAINHCGVSADDLRLTGDVVLGVGIDLEGQNAINEWVWISAALAFVIAWFCLRSIKMAILVFVVSQYCQALCEAAVYYSGGSMNLLVGMSPVLVYVLSLSACVHLANYYRDAMQRRGLKTAPLVAVKMGWHPCLIAAVTTSLGLLSLCVSHVRPVKEFGVYSSVGVLLGFGVLIALLPGQHWFQSAGDRTSNSQLRSHRHGWRHRSLPNTDSGCVRRGDVVPGWGPAATENGG